MKNVKELMAKNVFVNKDGSIECINAFVEMTAYYVYAIKHNIFDVARCLGQIDILKALSRKEGYSWAEIYINANKLVSNAEVIAKQSGLAKAI